MTVRITSLQPEHWTSVERIYIEGMESKNATFETESPGWDAWNAHHLQACRFVALLEQNVAGWGALLPVSKRAVYRGVAEVSVYVSNKYKGQGVGKALLEKLIYCSEEHGIWTLQAILFTENKISYQLHKKQGFREVGFREKIGKHFGKWRDTVLLERRSNKIN